MKYLLALAALSAPFAVSRSDEPKVLLKPGAMKTLVNPECSHCIDEAKARAQELKPDDRTLVWTRGKYDGGAIPIRFFLDAYPVISDSYGTFVHDADAGFSRGFRASYDFQFAGWRNGVLALKHKDGTLFSGLSGRGFDGPRRGERLERWPTIVTDWSWAVREYPKGVAYRMFEKYQPVERPAKPNADAASTRGQPDPRLPAEELVLGIDSDDPRAPPRAYPLKDLAAVPTEYALRRDSLGDSTDAVILWHGPTRTASAYRPTAARREPAKELGTEGKILEERGVELVLDIQPERAPYRDRATDSRFDMAGRGVSGTLKGWTLKPLDATVAKWYAWSAEYPETSVDPAAKAKADRRP